MGKKRGLKGEVRRVLGRVVDPAVGQTALSWRRGKSSRLDMGPPSAFSPPYEALFVTSVGDFLLFAP